MAVSPSSSQRSTAGRMVCLPIVEYFVHLFLLIIAFAGLFFQAAGMSQAQNVKSKIPLATGYEVVIAPSNLVPKNPDQIAWANDSTVLYVAKNTERTATSLLSNPNSDNRISARSALYALYAWNIYGGIDRITDEGKNAPILCVDRGNISLFMNIMDKNIDQRLEGSFGNPTVLIPNVVRRSEFNVMNCRLKNYVGDGNKKITNILYPEHGWLDFGPVYQDPPSLATLHRIDGQDVVLPIKLHRSIDKFCVSYIEFREEYFVWECSIGRNGNERDKFWKKSDCFPYHWLRPTGEVENGCLPWGPWFAMNSNLQTLVPTKMGIIAVEGIGQTSKSGLYILTNSGGFQILPGFVRLNGSRSISKDGCKLAASYSKNYEESLDENGGKISVISIDLCGRG